MPNPPPQAAAPQQSAMFSFANHTLSRRNALRLGALTTAVAVSGTTAACSTKPNTALTDGHTTLTIGYVPIACVAPLLIADAKGLFKENGITVNLRKFAGWADLWSAYATGELDVAHMLSPMSVAINAGTTHSGRPTELAFTQNTNGQAITLASHHHDHVHSASDMRGMVLGIPFEYSVHALLLRDFLATAGVDPIKDVELRLLRPSDMVAQLQVNGIDGFLGPEPFNQRAIASGAGRIFTLTKALWSGHPCCCIAMAKDWKRAHFTEAKAVLSALTAAAKIADDPEQHEMVAKILAHEKYLSQPEKLLIPALTGHYQDWEGKEVTDPKSISYGAATDATAITWMSTQIARWGLGGKTLDFNDATIIRQTDAVLPDDVPRGGDPININGREFDPNIPTANQNVKGGQHS